MTDAPTWSSRKPPECAGCPLWDEPGPVWGDGPPDAALVVVGEGPAGQEIAFGRPFSGGAGRVLTALLAGAAIPRSSVRIENVVCCRIPNDDADEFAGMEEAARHCAEHFLEPRLKEIQPHAVVPLGGWANWVLTERCSRDARGKPQAGQGIYGFRGFPYQSPIYDFLIVPTIHPAALMYDQSMWQVVVADLRRAATLAKDGYVAPPEEFLVPTTPDEVEQFLAAVEEVKVEVSVDIENPQDVLTIIGFGLAGGVALVVPFINNEGERYWREPDELRVIQAIYRLLANPEVDKIVHFEQHDRFWLEQYGFECAGRWWDTHVMHAILYPPLPHGLGFVGSVHTLRREWKSLIPSWTKEQEGEDK